MLRTFRKSIIPQYPDYEYHVILSYDSDVFEFSRKPLVDWDSVVKELKQSGAANVEQVKAVRSIEDWFLYDTEGLRKFLHLPGRFQMKGYSGQKGLEELFRKAKRTYIKGSACRGLVEALDMSVIIGRIRTEIQKLEKELI